MPKLNKPLLKEYYPDIMDIREELDHIEVDFNNFQDAIQALERLQAEDPEASKGVLCKKGVYTILFTNAQAGDLLPFNEGITCPDRR